mmetsp:Transcript_25509/g.73260  ORF Transcript_25509/g.73260 Transcript_25509/m.73260 type:complete len:220 (+) Transcript_25509:213-872(+)
MRRPAALAGGSATVAGSASPTRGASSHSTTTASLSSAATCPVAAWPASGWEPGATAGGPGEEWGPGSSAVSRLRGGCSVAKAGNDGLGLASSSELCHRPSAAPSGGDGAAIGASLRPRRISETSASRSSGCLNFSRADALKAGQREAMRLPETLPTVLLQKCSSALNGWLSFAKETHSSASVGNGRPSACRTAAPFTALKSSASACWRLAKALASTPRL